MKKPSSKKTSEPDTMRKNYDFSAGVRGKYSEAMKDGYTVRIRAADGVIHEKRVAPESLVSLEPDVQKYFPDSVAVNHALRTLIELVPDRRKAAAGGPDKGRATKIP